MKKLLTIILFMCMLTLSACTNANEDTTSSDDDKQPVVSISISEDDMLYTSTYDRMADHLAYVGYANISSDFLDASNNSDLTVKVKILAFVSNEVNSHSTVFLAQILDVFKGNVSRNDKIFLIQAGNSRDAIVTGFPIFNISDTLLVNLYDNHNVMVNGQNAYNITDIDLSIIQLYDYNGTEYAIERCLPEFLDCFDLTPINEDEANEVWDDIVKNDPIMSHTGHGEMYKYSDLEEKLKSLNAEK